MVVLLNLLNNQRCHRKVLKPSVVLQKKIALVNHTTVGQTETGATVPLILIRAAGGAYDFQNFEQV